MTSLRVFIIEPAESMRESLAMFVGNLGHDVIACDEPLNCPFYHSNQCECPQQHPCGDVLIVGQHLPKEGGLNFIENRLRGGCKGLVSNMALICAPWSATDWERAEKIGCRCFETPLDLGHLRSWLEAIAAQTSAGRRLADLDTLQIPISGQQPA